LPSNQNNKVDPLVAALRHERIDAEAQTHQATAPRCAKTVEGRAFEQQE
jgi:hypothetical protein